MARKSSLTPEIHDKLISALSSGATIADACAYVGITDRTYHNWMLRGETGRKSEYVRFFHDATRARVSARMGAVTIIRRAILDGNVNAAQWYLERSDPEHWARRTYGKIEGLDELIKLCNQKGIKASDLVEELVRELAASDVTVDSETGSESG